MNNDSIWPWRILIAEDNPADVKMVRRALVEYDITCELFVMTDGQQAFDIVEKIDSNSSYPVPDLMLIDLDLPIHDGMEIMQKVRASERCGQIPVIILTGSSSPDDKAVAKKFATSHYFQKTANFEAYLKIGGIIKEALEGTKFHSA
jgi:CheY-like chemotaxis protein